jgi:hypothetical protein
LNKPTHIWLELRATVQAHSLLIAILLAYCVTFLVLFQIFPSIKQSNILQMIEGFLIFSGPLIIINFIIVRLYHVISHLNSRALLPTLFSDTHQFFSDRLRLANGLTILALFIVSSCVFSSIKSTIPLVHPFSWDQTFSQIDAAMHFGSQPWNILHSILGYGPVTIFLNISYNFWFFALWTVVIYFAFNNTHSQLRTRFFLTYILVLIIEGNLLAIIFSSAGPAFYGKLGITPDPYAGLMQYLDQINVQHEIWAIPVQKDLWLAFINKTAFQSISAMPSIHNATAMLFALAVFPVSRRFGWLLTLHAAFIFIGSIELGWHYAIDAYVAWIVTYIIWRLSKPIAVWWHATEAQKRFDHLYLAASKESSSG